MFVYSDFPGLFQDGGESRTLLAARERREGEETTSMVVVLLLLVVVKRKGKEGLGRGFGRELEQHFRAKG